jgi:hypothetical protein
MPTVISNPTHLDRCTTGRIHGRATAGTGPGEELTPAQARALMVVYSTAEVDALIAGIDLSPYATISYVDSEIAAIDFSPYVPYTGATTNLNMGAFGVTAASLTSPQLSSASGGLTLSPANYTVSFAWDNEGTQQIHLGNNIGFTQFTQHLLIGNKFGGATYYYGALNANTGSFRVPSVGGFEITDGNAYSGTSDVKYTRNATGPKASIRAAGGLEVTNLAGSADAPITCSTVTASSATASQFQTIRPYAAGLLTFQTVFSTDIAYLGVGNGANLFFAPTAETGWSDAKLVRYSTGPAVEVQAAGGLRVRTAASAADGPLTCAALTASGQGSFTSSAYNVLDINGTDGALTCLRLANSFGNWRVGIVGPSGYGSLTNGTFSVGFNDGKFFSMTPAGAATFSSTVKLGTFTVGTLPSAAANVGATAYVTDSSVTTWGSTVAAGGANNVEVRSNGTNWTVTGI